jgi:large subunit ribosomal protein L25
MEKVVIKATPRTVTGKQVHALRRAGQLPGVIYGHNIKPMIISMNARDASRILYKLTSSSLVTIDLDGKEYPSLVREKQRNYVKGNVIHVDFQVVSLTEKIRANVGIELSGLSPAVKDFNAVLVTGLVELEVEAFPQDLPERIVVDISTLANVGDGIHVRDIVLSDKVQVNNAPEEMIVLATAAKEEVEEVPVVEAEVAAEGAAEPEVIEKGKKEEEEEAEGKEGKAEKK